MIGLAFGAGAELDIGRILFVGVAGPSNLAVFVFYRCKDTFSQFAVVNRSIGLCVLLDKGNPIL